MTTVADAGTSRDAFDIVVMGGGTVGLLFVRLLQAALPAAVQPRIAIIEPDPPAPEQPEIDLRVSALAPASAELLRQVEVWPQVPDEKCCPFERMCVWQGAGGPTGGSSLRFDAAGSGLPALGYITENHALRRQLWAQVAATEGCELITGRAAAVHIDSATGRVALADRQLTTRLLIGADGVNSWLRDRLGVAQREHDYAQRAVVAHLQPAEPHRATAWQKFLPAGPAALLPLADGRVSLVWTVDAAQADKLLSLEEAVFAARLTAELDGVLGELRCTTPRVAFPLGAAHAHAYVGTRFALLGDAAHRVHPLAGQGLNLGLEDAAVLARELAAHWAGPAADPGERRVLRRYERQRRGEVQLMLTSLTALNRVFSSPLAGLAGRGMHALDRLDSVKSGLARYAAGRSAGTG